MRAATGWTKRLPDNPAMLELLLMAFGLMVLVHAWGFLQRAQPWTETAEIPVYFALAAYAAALRFY